MGEKVVAMKADWTSDRQAVLQYEDLRQMTLHARSSGLVSLDGQLLLVSYALPPLYSRRHPTELRSRKCSKYSALDDFLV